MLLRHLKLSNFRNFHAQSFSFNPFLTIVIGSNARGKTNLLEAVYFIVNGTGFRESREEELITKGEVTQMVDGIFVLGDDEQENKIVLTNNQGRIDKIFMINKAKRKSLQYQEESTKTILFSPEQLSIIIGPPQERREYFDRLISFYDPVYKKRGANYENGLRKRNKILEYHSNENQLKEELTFWNDYLVEQAAYISLKREEYLQYLNQHPEIEDKQFQIGYLQSKFTKEALEKVFDLEKRYRRTLIGPQKDDFVISKIDKDEKFNIHHFGSRSEQRLGVFWLHLNEVMYYEKHFHKKPIILLDDIFSELDTHNKKLVINLIRNYQTILTTTEGEIIELADIPKSIIQL